MALGNNAIQSAKSTLNTISTKCEDAATLNTKLKALFEDSNFQKFVSETTTGATSEKKLQDLYSWIEKLLTTVGTLEEVTNSFLTKQENLNG